MWANIQSIDSKSDTLESGHSKSIIYVQVLVSQQVYDLLEMHAIKLEKSIDDLEGELRLTGAYDNDLSSIYNSPSFVAMEAGRSQTPHILEAWDSTSDGIGNESGSLMMASSLPSLLFTRSLSLLGPQSGLPGGSGLRTLPSLKRAREEASNAASSQPDSKVHAPSQKGGTSGGRQRQNTQEKVAGAGNDQPPGDSGQPKRESKVRDTKKDFSYHFVQIL